MSGVVNLKDGKEKKEKSGVQTFQQQKEKEQSVIPLQPLIQTVATAKQEQAEGGAEGRETQLFKSRDVPSPNQHFL